MKLKSVTVKETDVAFELELTFNNRFDTTLHVNLFKRDGWKELYSSFSYILTRIFEFMVEDKEVSE